MQIDEERLQDFVNRFARDFGAALHASTVVLGDKLGLYRALADLGPTDAVTLAAETGCDRRLVQEWLNAQYVAGYCHYSAQTTLFWLSPEQAAVLADTHSPACLVGAMTIAVSTAKDEEKLSDAFRSGKGLGWHEHHHDLFHGTERLCRPGYVANLASEWIPRIEGLDERLTRGGRVADIGCGHGSSSIVLAETYPDIEVFGFDYHPASIDVARKRAAEAGVADRVEFQVASAQTFPGSGFDLVCIFDALHDMGDPVGAARHVREALAPDGVFLLVEPMAGEHLDDNVTPVGRIFYAASTTICTPAAQAQPGGYALGSQVPEATWAELLADAGFSHFRRAAETPFNRIFEARR